MRHLRKHGKTSAIGSLIAVALLLAARVSGAAETNDLCGGDWYGLLDVTVDDHEITLNMHRLDGGRCVGTLQIPDRDVLDAPLSDTQFDGEKISFTVRSLGQVVPFVASLSADG